MGYKMIGNAVPVNLAYHVAMSIRHVLDRHDVLYGLNDEDVIEVCNKRFGMKKSEHKSVTYQQLSFPDLFEQYADSNRGAYCLKR